MLCCVVAAGQNGKYNYSQARLCCEPLKLGNAMQHQHQCWPTITTCYRPWHNKSNSNMWVCMAERKSTIAWVWPAACLRCMRGSEMTSVRGCWVLFPVARRHTNTYVQCGKTNGTASCARCGAAVRCFVVGALVGFLRERVGIIAVCASVALGCCCCSHCWTDGCLSLKWKMCTLCFCCNCICFHCSSF